MGPDERLRAGLRERFTGWEAWRALAFLSGLAIAAGTVASPLDSLGEDDLVTAHVAQHIALGDFAAPLLLLGLPPPARRRLGGRVAGARSARPRRRSRTNAEVKRPSASANPARTTGAAFGRPSALRSDVSRKPIGGQKPRMFPTRRLDVYLNDHLAGATGGIELCRRALRENLGTDLGAFLEVLLQEIAEDRRTLEDVASRLDTDRSPLKPAGAWALEKAARLKLNGRLRGYSPLSRLIELEALQAGVSAKRSLWQALQAAFPEDPRLRGVDLDALVQRADHQLGEIEAQRLAVASAALS